MVSSYPAKTPQNQALSRSFAQVLHDSCEIQISQLLRAMIKGDSLYIKIMQEEYELGLTECKKNLHGRLLLKKGDKPVSGDCLRPKNQIACFMEDKQPVENGTFRARFLRISVYIR
jgi:hypothetical protein